MPSQRVEIVGRFYFDSFLDLWVRFMETFESFSLEAHDYIERGNSVLVLLRMKGRTKRGGV